MKLIHHTINTGHNSDFTNKDFPERELVEPLIKEALKKQNIESYYVKVPMDDFPGWIKITIDLPHCCMLFDIFVNDKMRPEDTLSIHYFAWNRISKDYIRKKYDEIALSSGIIMEIRRIKDSDENVAELGSLIMPHQYINLDFDRLERLSRICVFEQCLCKALANEIGLKIKDEIIIGLRRRANVS